MLVTHTKGGGNTYSTSREELLALGHEVSSDVLGVGEGMVRLDDLTTLHPAIALRVDEAQGARPKQRVERSDHVPPLALRGVEGGPILKVLF